MKNIRKNLKAQTLTKTNMKNETNENKESVTKAKYYIVSDFSAKVIYPRQAEILTPYTKVKKQYSH